MCLCCLSVNLLFLHALDFLPSQSYVIFMCVCSELSVWTSNMRRAKDTAKEVKAAHHVEWRSLREIEVQYVVWCSVMWCDVVWCGVMWYGVMWCGNMT